MRAVGKLAMIGVGLVVVVAAHLVHAKGPELTLNEDYYRGSVSEDGGRVEVNPPIQATNGPICGYRIVPAHSGRIPFEIFMLDQTTGLAELRARSPLDCEEKKEYRLHITAVSCTGEMSDRAEVRVIVTDVNEYSPEWEEDEYSGEVAEGEMLDYILKVKAFDKDCSHTFGTVCGYNISGGDQPFVIDEKGVIRNKQPLSAEESRSHVISVVAKDCGGRESSPILVTISVLPKCITSWTDVSTSMTYIPGTGPQPVFPQARLQLCPGNGCPSPRLETTLTLHTDHVGVGCDRDTYSIASQRKMCGASSQAVDLLPAGAKWLSDVKTDVGREVGPVYHFDGQTGAVVPNEVMPRHTLGSEFTISTWMRHPGGKNQDKHSKEHIICSADDHRKNRHHLSLFVRNCKLVMLIRREYKDAERNVFKPAEFRWSLPQVCDDRWHHYAVSVSKEAGVELTLDGEPWQPQPNNPEVIDDWPLHPAGDLSTTLTVGACWHGSDGKMRHALNGYLAGLAVLTGRREHAEVLKCLVQCSESLQLPATNLLDPGMEMVTNSHGSQVTIDGEDAANMEELVRRVAYLNTREFPAPGRRRLELTTTMTCRGVGGGEAVKRDIPAAVSRILVLPVPQPSIGLSGTDNFSRGYEDFKRGVRIFSDLRLSVSRPENSQEESYGEDEAFLASPVSDTKVDKCSVSVFPPLNPDHETIHLPQSMLHTLKIVGSLNENGAEIRGADMLYNYEQVLRQVTYANQKPAYYLNRQFKLVCSELNERFVSNEYVQTLTVIHPPISGESLLSEPVVAHQHISYHGAELPTAHFLTSPNNPMLSGQAQGHAIVFVVVACVGVLVGVLGVGVARLRSAHRRSREEEMAEVEMAWDDTALNITVNPMEATECGGMGGGPRATDSEIDESSDDDIMYAEESDEDDEDEDDDDDEDDDEVVNGPVRHRLEWDNDI